MASSTPSPSTTSILTTGSSSCSDSCETTPTKPAVRYQSTSSPTRGHITSSGSNSDGSTAPPPSTGASTRLSVNNHHIQTSSPKSGRSETATASSITCSAPRTPTTAATSAIAPQVRTRTASRPQPHKRASSAAATPADLLNTSTLTDSTLTTLMDDPEELARCSREVLVEMVVRQRRELEEVTVEKGRLEESHERLTEENAVLKREVEITKGRFDDSLTEQARMEAELAGRIEVLDKLRTTVRDCEREKRDSEKRYREQGESFDSERQSWYDQEQHYKNRIANLSANNRRPRASEPPLSLPKPPRDDKGSDEESGSDSVRSRASRRSSSPRRAIAPSSRSSTPSTGPTPNELALQEQLGTLTTAHSSLTNTLRALQVELAELKRVYQDLQEENESYEILLGERTLNGTVQGTELFRRSSLWNDEGLSPNLGTLAPVRELDGEKSDRSRSGSEDEDDESDSESGDEEEEDDIEKVLLESKGIGSPDSGAVQAGSDLAAGGKRKPAPRKSAGLDLAAELEAAQMAEEEPEKQQKKLKKKSKKIKSTEGAVEEDLVAEIKQLREANKALTLYVSKIVDRVCSQEGFEKVLAVDYRLATPKMGGASPTQKPIPPPKSVTEESASRFRSRSGSGGFFKNTLSSSLSSSTSALPPPGPRDTDPLSSSTNSNSNNPLAASTNSNASAEGGSRGFSWGSVVNTFGFTRPSAPAHTRSASGANFKPFMLSSDTARKLETEEDEDDTRERERLRAEMALHGIDEPVGNSSWTKTSPQLESSSSGAVSAYSTPVPSDHLYHASSPVVQEKLDTIVAQEKAAKHELDQGRASGFTEVKPRRHARKESMTSSRSSSSGIGLGISGDQGGITPERLESSFSSPATTASPEVAVTKEAEENGGGPGWQKRLKRLSISGWNSPPLS